MGWFFPLIDISRATADRFYTWGWAASLTGAAITFIGVVFLMWGTRVRDHDFERNIGELHESAAQSEERSKKLEGSNLALQRDLEREKIEWLKLEEKSGARNFNAEQRALILDAFRGITMRVYVRCLDDTEAFVAANNFARVLREAGLDVPEVEGVGTVFPPASGINVYDPAGVDGLFARTMLAALSTFPGVVFETSPFVIGGVPLDPANPAMVVLTKIPQ